MDETLQLKKYSSSICFQTIKEFKMSCQTVIFRIYEMPPETVFIPHNVVTQNLLYNLMAYNFLTGCYCFESKEFSHS
jgi:hypothetical protein